MEDVVAEALLLLLLEQLSKQAVYEFSVDEPHSLRQVDEAIQVLRDALRKGDT